MYYKEQGNFYTGTIMPVVGNVGGIFLELGDEIQSVFYKIDDDHWFDVNRQIAVQIPREGSIVTSSYILIEESLKPIDESLIRR